MEVQGGSPPDMSGEKITAAEMVEDEEQKLVWLKQEYKRQRKRLKEKNEELRARKFKLSALVEGLEIHRNELLAEIRELKVEIKDGRTRLPKPLGEAQTLGDVDNSAASVGHASPSGDDYTKQRQGGMDKHLADEATALETQLEERMQQLTDEFAAATGEQQAALAPVSETSSVAPWMCEYCNIENTRRRCKVCGLRRNCGVPNEPDDGTSSTASSTEGSVVPYDGEQAFTPEGTPGVSQEAEMAELRQKVEELQDRLDRFSQVMFEAYSDDASAAETQRTVDRLFAVGTASVFFHAIHGLKMKNAQLTAELATAQSNTAVGSTHTALEYDMLLERAERAEEERDLLAKKLDTTRRKMGDTAGRLRRERHELKEKLKAAHAQRLTPTKTSNGTVGEMDVQLQLS